MKINCTKTSKSYTKKHTYTIANCNELGQARCVYCGAAFDKNWIR